MEITALKTFRIAKGKVAQRGDQVTVDDNYGAELVRTGLAANGKKALKEIEDKMVKSFENKGMPTEPETYEERVEGKSSTAKKSSGEKVNAKDPFIAQAGQNPEKNRIPDKAVQPETGGITHDRAASGVENQAPAAPAAPAVKKS